MPAAKERGDRGRGTSAFEMVLSPGAGRTSAAGVQPPSGYPQGRFTRQPTGHAPQKSKGVPWAIPPRTPAAEPIGLRKTGKKRSLRVIPPPAGCHSGKVSQCRKRFNPGDARGEAPCIRKLKTSPFPGGEGGWGDGGKIKAKGRAGRQPQPPPPAGYSDGKVIRQRRGKPPRLT